jgi:diguanylate cyclase
MAKILVVEDERPVRLLLQHFLADAAHTVLLATDGQEALRLVAQARPDLILSDVMMPMLDGVGLCRQLKASPATATIPIILMSAVRTSRMEESGADAFLAKPFDLDELDSVIQHWLGASSPDGERR